MGGGRGQVVQHAAQIDPGGGGLDEQGRINRRLKQRQLADDALNVHAVANLEKPVFDRIPIFRQVIVGRNAEIEGLDFRQWLAAVRRRHYRNREQGVFDDDVDSDVAELVQLRLEL